MWHLLYLFLEAFFFCKARLLVWFEASSVPGAGHIAGEDQSFYFSTTEKLLLLSWRHSPINTSVSPKCSSENSEAKKYSPYRLSAGRGQRHHWITCRIIGHKKLIESGRGPIAKHRISSLAEKRWVCTQRALYPGREIICYTFFAFSFSSGVSPSLLEGTSFGFHSFTREMRILFQAPFYLILLCPDFMNEMWVY